MPEGAVFGAMPCTLTTASNETYCGTKLITLFPGNKAPLPTIQGVIVLFGHAQQGQPLAMIEASSVTGLRTAAASGLATDLLARKDATVAAIIGTGVQAKSHVAAMLSVRRNLQQIFIWGRTSSSSEALAKELKTIYASAHPTATFIAASTIEEAVKDADIICTVTASSTPVITDSMIVKPGVHINAVGAHSPTKREIDGPLMKRASVWADLKASSLSEGGDFLIPLREGLYGEDHLQGELSDLVSGAKKGRIDDKQITVFNSLGIAIEDLQCAIHLFKEVSSAQQSEQHTARLMSRL